VKDYIKVQESIHKIPKKVCFSSALHFYYFWDTSLYFPWQADQFANSHKVGNNTQNKMTWKGCDNTGLMGSCCCHDLVVFLANIHGTG
jgi:hypothetical protein